MSALYDRDSVTEDIFDRIRNLKELIRSEDLGESGAVSRSSGSRPENSRQSSPSLSSHAPRQRHLSQPTRDSPQQKNPPEEANKGLIEETWHLLTQVTYVRVVIDRITWEEAPKLLLEELRNSRNPRQKSLIVLEYWFPTGSSSNDGSVSSRDLGKKVVVPAKDVLLKVVHFNHRRVVLLQMTHPLLQLWSQSYLTVKVLAGKKLNVVVGKCTIPLCKLLVLPFSLSGDLALEPISDHVKCSGKLKVCIQLGSRFQSFSERVEPMRNPTTAISELTSVDPMKLVAHIKATPLIPQVPATRSQTSEQFQPTVQEEMTNEKWALPATEPNPYSPSSTPSPYSKHVRAQQPRYEELVAERRMNETFSKRSEETPVLSSLRGRSPIHSAYRPSENEPSSTRYCSPAARPIRDRAFEAFHSRVSEPYVSNISVYGNRPAPLTSGYHSKTASVQTEPSYHSPRPPVFESQPKSDAASQTSFVLERDPISMDNKTRVQSRGKRRQTVAEKILMNRSSFSLNESQESLSIPSRRNHGFWLQLTIHRARNLPMIKDAKEENESIKPRCYWTYTTETGTGYSPIAAGSCEPVWEWSHKMYLPPQRKTLVMKLWHRCMGSRDRVLGFVAILFPIVHPFDRVWYDIIDLTRSSTGQVEISFAYATGDNVEAPFSTQTHTRADLMRDYEQGTKEVHKKQPQSLDRKSPRHELIEKGVNVTLAEELDDHRWSSCSSPFIALTSRSFLSQKLRTNLDELAALTTQLNRSHSTDGPAVPRRESQTCESDVALEEIEPDNLQESRQQDCSPAGSDTAGTGASR